MLLMTIILLFLYRPLHRVQIKWMMSVANVVKVRSNQEEIKSNMETGGERIESSVETEGDRTGYNVETKENGTKKCLHSVETKEKEKKCTSRTWT